MGKPVKIRVQEHREKLRAAGLRPVQLWLPNTASASFKLRCERESASLRDDLSEADVLAWIAEVSETEGWE
jgi:hypothetical protein